MQPYQEYEEEIKRRNRQTGSILKNIGSAAFSLGTSSFVAKTIPFLNDLLPKDLAMKGLNKINPKLGKFVQSAMKDGFDFEEVRDFLKEKVSGMEEKPKSIFQNLVGDIDISTLPESQQKQLGFLQMAAEELERKGVGPNDEPFKKLAKKVKDVLKGKTKVLEAEAMEMQPEQPMQPQQPSQQAGPGQQALMAILQKIQAQRAGGG